MKIMGMVPKVSAVTTYRIIRPLKKVGGKTMRCFQNGFGTLLKKDEKITPAHLAYRFKKKADVWVIKYIEDLNTANLLVWMRNKEKFKLIVDIDDNVWEIPYGNITIEGKEAMDAHIKRGFWTVELVKAADAVTVSTEEMREKLKNLNPRVVVIPNLIDEKDWKYKRKKHDKIRIGWIYSHTHIPDIREVKFALNDIKKKYGDKVEIIIFGHDLQVFDEKPTHVWGVKFKDYPKKLTELSFDISICPLEDNEFNRCKSNIKWMESSMSGAAVVASDVAPYSKSIEHGITGFLAKDNEDFVKYISLLIEDEKLRKNMVKNAKQEILEKYNIKTDKTIEEFYKSL